MTQFALIKNGVVENVILADAAYAATLSGYDAVLADPPHGVGWHYSDGMWSAPVSVDQPVEPSPPPSTTLTQLQFRLLLTQAERLAVRQKRREDDVLDDVMDLMDFASEINLSNPLTIQGLSYACSLGCFTPDRLTQILAGQAP